MKITNDMSRQGFFSRRMMSLVVCVVLIALLPVATGCYGAFPLTHAIYKFNGQVTEYKIVHTLVLWAFLIIPVYYIAFLGDFIIFNLIEFWTGDKLVTGVQTLEDGTRLAVRASEDGNEAAVEVSRDGAVILTARLVRLSNTELQILDDSGREIGKIVRTASSGLVITDAHGATVSAVTAEEITRMNTEPLQATLPQ